MSEPSLVSNDTKFFLSETLKQCHKIKENYYSYIYNVCAFIFLILLFGTILIVKYRGKPTEQEKNEKNNKQKEYILSKIKSRNTPLLIFINGLGTPLEIDFILSPIPPARIIISILFI